MRGKLDPDGLSLRVYPSTARQTATKNKTNCLPLIEKHSALSSQQSAKEKPNPLHRGGAKKTNQLLTADREAFGAQQSAISQRKNQTRFTAEARRRQTNCFPLIYADSR
jgi:hypothetical protein